MIWASSHKLGCGLAKCARGGPRNKPFFNYVCNYCPMWVLFVTELSNGCKSRSLALTRIYCNHVAKSLAVNSAVVKDLFIMCNCFCFCKKINDFVFCHSGNRIEQLGTPYKKGKPCSSCLQSCHSKKIRFETPLVLLVPINWSFVFVRLCVNSCNAADLWANCRELYKTWPGWLCRTNTTEGIQRQHNCLATCNCQGKIHD